SQYAPVWSPGYGPITSMTTNNARPTDESNRSAQLVVRDRCDCLAGNIGVEHPGGHVLQSLVCEFRVDLLDGCVLPMDVISPNSVETIRIEGGEERVVPVEVE